MFTILRPTDFKSIKMTMEKEEYENIKIGNNVYKTVIFFTVMGGFMARK